MSALAGAALLLGALAPAALSSEASDERAGATLLRAVDTGKRNCDSLTDTDFERVGDHVMGRMLGSTSAHESMDDLMKNMMGERSTTSAHVVMGRRFARCAGDEDDSAFNGMMGIMGSGYGSGPGGMMGSGSGRDGTFMGAGTTGGSDGWSGADTAMAIAMGALILILAGGLLAWKPWRDEKLTRPIDILRERLASGEIEQDEFDSRRAALGGGA